MKVTKQNVICLLIGLAIGYNVTNLAYTQYTKYTEFLYLSRKELSNQTITTNDVIDDKLTYTVTNTSINILNHYDDLKDNEKALYFGAYGSPRSGSTALYNMIRMLVHDKIDPDIYSGFYMGDEYKKFIDEKFSILHKSHQSCDKSKAKLVQVKWWDKRNITIYTSYRDVRDQICSVTKFSNNDIRKDKNKYIKQCNNYAAAFHSCNSDEFKDLRKYNMLFDDLITNRTNVIYELSKSMGIEDTMTKQDYMRVEDEMDHLKPATNCNKGNQINQLHCDHIGDKSVKCDYEGIFNVIQSSKDCLDLYHIIRDRRIAKGYIDKNDENYPKLALKVGE